MKESDEIIKLLDSIISVSTIECTKCGKKESMQIADEWDAAEDWVREGWRATDTHTYCPVCAATK